MLFTRNVSPSYTVARSLLISSALFAVINASLYSVGPPVRFDALSKRASPVLSGCYSSSGSLTMSKTYMWQSSGWCQENCINATNAAVIGLTNGGDCWCGNTVPPASSKVDNSKCSTGCDGFGEEKCGGNGYWTVYLTGTGTLNALASSTSTKPQVITSVAPGQTVIVTLPPSSGSNNGKGSANTAGVAAGIVVGIVGAAALSGGLFLFLRRRRQRAAEEEFRRNQQVSEFMRSSNEPKPPPSAYSSISDSRLDPVTGRRDSSGSLADAQDYSRRILRVANPDR